jgi:hypothetical protein
VYSKVRLGGLHHRYAWREAAWTTPKAVFPPSQPPSASPTTRDLAERFGQEDTPTARKAKLRSGRGLKEYLPESVLARAHQRPPPPRNGAPSCDQVLATRSPMTFPRTDDATLNARTGRPRWLRRFGGGGCRS